MGGELRSTLPHHSKASYPQLATQPKGKQISHIYKDRLKQFTDDGQYKEHGLIPKIVEDRITDLHLTVWDAPDLTRPTFDEATKKDNKYRKTQIGDSFGPSWSTHWFKVQFSIPSDWSHKSRIELHWDASNEGLVWSEDGKPLQGLTGGGERIEWVIPDDMRDHSQTNTIYIEMACNGMFGCAPGGDSIQPPDPNKQYQLRQAEIASINLDARALFYDFWIIGDAAREFPEDSWQQHQALQVCNEIMDKFIAGDGSRAAIVDCRTIAKKYLGEHVDSAKVYDNDNEAIISGIGHCHIDTCWLWPFAETKRKVARSWSNQCDLLDRYPEHRFCASQAQQYKWLEKFYPYAWDRVKEHVKKGNFQPVGGSWVEHDTNLPSGESLVRQFVYGQRFFESRFGQRCRTFWLPDTFGYSTQLPQLCRLAGMNRFFTQKLSWNNINNFPHTTFNWVALDGSQVICHMAPSETYTAEAHFGDVKRSMTQHKSMDQDATSLLVFGKGDGGGGPTWGHIEKLRRCRGLADKVGLLPRVKMGGSVDDFFDRLEHKTATGDVDYVTWYGELYFELHRGTYTTQANNKRNNRKTEVLLNQVEYFATLATLYDSKNYKYPKVDIDSMWENVLLCQFHDCLPGSSIGMCYDESDNFYKFVFATGQKLLDEAFDVLGFKKADAGGDRLILSSLEWERRPARKIARNDDSFQHTKRIQQDATDPHPRKRSYSSKDEHSPRISQVSDTVFVLENKQLKVTVDDGLITSLWDHKAQREVLAKGKKANQYVIFDDKPLYWQAWDVEVFHLESRKPLQTKPGSVKIKMDSYDAVEVAFTTKISEHSEIITTLALGRSDTGPAKVEVTADVKWHETMKFLKVEFPTSIVNTEASYETQFGVVRRPTHYNTTWDMAKFEVCCHKWADLSESSYGVSILNESKYGFATCGSLMRLSLLRAPKAPDDKADMGKHHMKWAIMPHAGPLSANTVKAGLEFNHPVHLRSHAEPSVMQDLMQAFTLASPPDGHSSSLIIDTIKRGEDDEDASNSDMPAKKGRHVIVRVYDSMGGLSRGFIKFGPVKVSKAWKTNLLEDELEELEITNAGGSGVEIELRAFEVATYKFLLA